MMGLILMMCVLDRLSRHHLPNFRYRFPRMFPDRLNFMVYFIFLLNFFLLFNYLLNNYFYSRLILILRNCFIRLMLKGRLFDMWILFMLN